MAHVLLTFIVKKPGDMSGNVRADAGQPGKLLEEPCGSFSRLWVFLVSAFYYNKATLIAM